MKTTPVVDIMGAISALKIKLDEDPSIENLALVKAYEIPNLVKSVQTTTPGYGDLMAFSLEIKDLFWKKINNCLSALYKERCMKKLHTLIRISDMFIYRQQSEPEVLLFGRRTVRIMLGNRPEDWEELKEKYDALSEEDKKPVVRTWKVDFDSATHCYEFTNIAAEDRKILISAGFI